MSKERPFEDIKPIAKFNTTTASREELVSYIEKLERDLESMNDTILCWVEKDKAQQGEWIKEDNGRTTDLYRCSICGRSIMRCKNAKSLPPFCPNCGAKMRKGGTE